MTEPKNPQTGTGNRPAAPKSQALQSSEARYAAWATRLKGTQETTAQTNRDLAPAVEEAPADAPAAGDLFDMDLLFTTSARLGREAAAKGEPDAP